MFEQKNEKNMGGAGTIVGSNVQLSGALKDSGDITIHGKVEGEVFSEKNVLVEKTANIKGPITAQSITVAGEIHGEVKAMQKLEILETGKIIGSIGAKDLVVKSGAVFNGKSKMIGEEETKPKEKKSLPSERPETIESKKTQPKIKQDKKPNLKNPKKYELE